MRCSCQFGSLWRATLLTVMATLAASSSALAEEASPEFAAPPHAASAVPGARVEELLELGRRLNPGLAASALEAQAAQARIGTTGRYPDPMFRTELWDMRAARDNALP